MNTTIVTEGRGGIGLATARTLLRIVRSARSSWWTSTLARPPAFTDRVHLIACDVTDPASEGRTGADRIGGPAGGRSGELRRYRHERSHRRHRAGRLHSTPRSSHPGHLAVVTSAGSLTRRAGFLAVSGPCARRRALPRRHTSAPATKARTGRKGFTRVDTAVAQCAGRRGRRLTVAHLDLSMDMQIVITGECRKLRRLSGGSWQMDLASHAGSAEQVEVVVRTATGRRVGMLSDGCSTSPRRAGCLPARSRNGAGPRRDRRLHRCRRSAPRRAWTPWAEQGPARSHGRTEPGRTSCSSGS